MSGLEAVDVGHGAGTCSVKELQELTAASLTSSSGDCLPLCEVSWGLPESEHVTKKRKFVSSSTP